MNVISTNLKQKDSFILEKYLNRIYHINEKGDFDKLCVSINCWEQILYHVLRNYNLNYKYAFCDDINSVFSENQNKCLFYGLTLNLNHELYKIDEWFAYNDNLQLIETLINGGKVIALRTMFDMLPSYAWYDENSVGTHNWHFNMIVGYNSDYYYVVDSPLVFNNINDVKHEDNPTIHLIKKPDMNHALNKYCEIKTVEINFKNIGKVNKLKQLLPLIVKNFYNEEQQKTANGYQYIGKKALQKFIDALNDDEKFSYLKENFFISHFEIHLLYSRRLILKWSLEEDDYFQNNRYYKLVITNLEKSLEYWYLLKHIVKNNNIKRLIDFKELILKCLLNILSCEDNLIYSIEKMISHG